jgi:DNA polymerase III epsilon subunit family exonuclease
VQENSLILPEREREALLECFPRGVVALDLETTGLSPLIDKIIELSAIKISPQGDSSFDQLIDPEIAIPQHTIEIHGIKDQDVLGKPKIAKVLTEFVSFCDGLPLIAHNARFDIGFIVFQLHQLNLALPESKAVCSVKLSRQVFKQDVENHKLSTLAAYLDIPLVNHHRALDDAFAALRITALALVKQKESGKINLGEAVLFRLSDFNKSKNFEIPEKLQGLSKKIAGGQIVDIKYSGGNHKNQFRPVRPIGLLPMPEGAILYAHCLQSNLYKSFSLRKIVEFKELSAEEIRVRLEKLPKNKN